MVYWTCIALLYIYYFIARGLGFASPLGNVDLGSVMGNSAWNDTHDGLVKTTTGASSMSTVAALSDSPVASQTFLLTLSATSARTTSGKLDNVDSILQAMQAAGGLSGTMIAVATAAPSASA